MKLVIAGGGTGGHLFPGIAVAEALVRLDSSAEVLFVGTERGIEARAVPKAGFSVDFIRIGGLKRVGLKKKLTTLWALPASILESRRILQRFGAHAVLGVGGYASGPVLLAARTLGLPTAICEQNSVPGLTNRVLGKWVHQVYGSFESSRTHFPSHKFQLVGNPVRDGFRRAAQGSLVPHEPDLIFVFGGSQGARVLNECAPLALAELKSRGISVRALHQAGKSEVDAVRAAYENVGIPADVTPFIDDMVSAYRRAAIVVCRAGATSCAELTALGIPSVLVPFPFAADDHQTTNAMDLVEKGAARMLKQADLTPARLADEVAAFLTDSQLRSELSQKAKAAGHLDAADVVARAAIAGFPSGGATKLLDQSGATL